MHSQTVPTLKRNKSGWFEIRWSEKDDAGKWRSYRTSTHTKDQKVAKDALWRHLDPSGGVIAGAQGPLYVGELLDQYEKSAEMRGVKNTQAMALRPIRRAWATHGPAGITPQVVTQYTRERMLGWYTQKRIPAQPSTVRRELAAFAAAMHWCVRKKLIRAEDCPDIDLPPNGAPRERFLTEAECAELGLCATEFDRQHGTNVYLFVLIAIDCCARAESIESLTWGRVSFDRNQIDFRDPAKPETSKRRCVVPMSVGVSTAMCDALTNKHARNNDELVVGPIPHNVWKRFIDTTPYKDLTRHDLRRTGASLLVHRGVDLMKVAKMLGDDPQTVIKHYARFAPDYLADVHKPTH